jgi:hypothetical protein
LCDHWRFAVFCHVCFILLRIALSTVQRYHVFARGFPGSPNTNKQRYFILARDGHRSLVRLTGAACFVSAWSIQDLRAHVTMSFYGALADEPGNDWQCRILPPNITMSYIVSRACAASSHSCHTVPVFANLHNVPKLPRCFFVLLSPSIEHRRRVSRCVWLCISVPLTSQLNDNVVVQVPRIFQSSYGDYVQHARQRRK